MYANKHFISFLSLSLLLSVTSVMFINPSRASPGLSHVQLRCIVVSSEKNAACIAEQYPYLRDALGDVRRERGLEDPSLLLGHVPPHANQQVEQSRGRTQTHCRLVFDLCVLFDCVAHGN